ncbi:MAG: hypothetical protein ACSHX8_04605 [Opitutaceae bacterium]
MWFYLVEIYSTDSYPPNRNTPLFTTVAKKLLLLGCSLSTNLLTLVCNLDLDKHADFIIGGTNGYVSIERIFWNRSQCGMIDLRAPIGAT